jgi:hypothetical protein
LIWYLTTICFKRSIPFSHVHKASALVVNKNNNILFKLCNLLD